MITTLTPNPSFDQTIAVDSFEPGEVMAVRGGTVEAGGKGINVATALVRAGHPARAFALCGDASIASFRELVDPAVPIEVVSTPGATRTNLTIREANGTTSKLNEPGPEVSAEAARALMVDALASVDHGGWLAACGSLPPSMPTSFYADLADAAAIAGVRLAVDTSGAALGALVGHPVALVKPNQDELAAVVNAAVLTLGDVVAAAERLRSAGAEAVLVSLGADGAVLVDAAGAVHGESPTDAVRNTVGAGDAMLAGYLSVADDRLAALRAGLAWGRAAVSSPTTAFDPATIDLETVIVHDTIDSARVLFEAV